MPNDYLLYCLSSILLYGGLHVWLRRRHQGGLPQWIWITLAFYLLGSALVIEDADDRERARQSIAIRNASPAYTGDLERLRQEVLSQGTSTSDPVYLEIIEAEKRLEKLKPVINDVSTIDRRRDPRVFDAAGRRVAASPLDPETLTRLRAIETTRLLWIGLLGLGVVAGAGAALAFFRGIPIPSATPLKTGETELKAYFDSLPFGCWAIDEQGRYSMFNRIARATFGDHYLGKTLQECSHLLPPETLRLWQSNNGRASAGETVDYIYSTASGGRKHHYHNVIAPVRSEGRIVGVIGTAVDVSERVEADEARRAADTKLALHTSQTPLGIIEWDLSFAIRSWNPAAESIFGLPATEVVGCNGLDLLFSSEERRAVEANWRELFNGGGQAHAEHTFTRADGRKRLCEWHHTPLVDAQGKVIAMASFVQDITSRAQLESQLRRVQRRDSMGQLAGGLAHELKNLFTPALIHLDLLEQENRDMRTLLEQTRPIRKAVTQAIDLSQRMLSLGRTSEQEKPSWQPLNPHVQDTVELLRRALDQRIRIIVVLAPNLPQLPLSAGMVTQIVMNLLLNARDAVLAKFTDAPVDWNPMIRITTCSIVAAPHAIEGQPAIAPKPCQCIEVSDNGVGMEESTRQRVFEPFFTTKETGQGIGLGLAIAWKSAQSFGGWIEVDSVPHQGATFRVFLPSPVPPKETAPQTPVPDSKPAIAVGQTELSRHILLAEDDDMVSRALTLGMQRAGHRVTCANDGAAALALIRLEPSAYDLVVTDLNMPNLGGRDLLAVLSREGVTVPVIVLSGHITSAILDELQSLGAAQVLRKPLRIEDLKAAIAEITAERRASATQPA